MNKEPQKKPRILFFDIETTPNVAYVWGKWEQNIIAYKRHWYIISFAWKWADEKTTHVLSLPDYPLYKKNPHDDKMLVKDLWKLFNEASVIVGHNSNAFDIKKSNARFMKHAMPPPSPYKKVDTKLVAKRHFKMDSNKLDDICDYFNIGRKINTGGFELWLGCERGDMASWKKMCEYNKHDVVLLEKVYLAMRPYMDNHPNIALMNGDAEACPSCGSFNLTKQGFKYSRVAKSQQYRCADCGAWHSSPIKEGGQVR